MPGAEAGADELGRGEDRAEVRVPRRRHRRRDADEDGVGGADGVRVGLDRAEAGAQRGDKAGVGDVLDGRAAPVELVDPGRAGVEPGHREARLREPEGERQPDVSEPDDRDGPILFHDASLA